MEEEFSLKWNDFQENTIKTFSKLRKEEDFFDVTLVSEDQKQMLAHRVVLSSCSEYFKNILKANKHSHPILCLSGIKSPDLENVLDYIYQGEVQIFQENIDKFLDVAQKLKLDGLLANEANNQHSQSQEKNPIKFDKIKQTQIFDSPTATHVFEEDSFQKTDVSFAVSIPVDGSSSIDKIEQKISEYLGKSFNGDYKCNLCGKTAGKNISHMKNHIETHLEGISFSCSVCGKQFRSRNSLSKHKTVYHK